MRRILQHLHHITAFQHRPDTRTNRLPAIGDDNLKVYRQLVSNEFEQLSQLVSFLKMDEDCLNFL